MVIDVISKVKLLEVKIKNKKSILMVNSFFFFSLTKQNFVGQLEKKNVMVKVLNTDFNKVLMWLADH